jgi:hypothetical protein
MVKNNPLRLLIELDLSSSMGQLDNRVATEYKGLAKEGKGKRLTFIINGCGIDGIDFHVRDGRGAGQQIKLTGQLDLDGVLLPPRIKRKSVLPPFRTTPRRMARALS